MYKLVASLLLVLSAVALVSQAAARSTTPQSVRLAMQATLDGHLADRREDVAAAGDYFELDAGHGVTVTYRLATLGATQARIDAVVVRDGLTVSEPSIEIALDAAASVSLDSPALALEFRIDANAPPN